MRKKFLTVLAILTFTPVCMILLIYFGLVWYYKGTYMNGITINDVYASGKTPEEMNEILLEKTDKASFTITDKFGKTYEIPIEDMNFTYTYLDELNKIQNRQNPLHWGMALVNGENECHAITPKGKCDTKALEDYLMSMELLQNQADPDRIRVEIIKEKDGYALVDETQNLLDKDAAVEAVEEAVLKGERYLNLEDAECYIEVEYTREMLNTLDIWNKVEKMQDSRIVCRFYDGDEVIDASVICNWILLDEDGEFLLDDTGELILDEEEVEEYVAGIAKAHDSTDGPWNFNPTRGGTITIEKGNYGYKLNQKKQKETLIEQVYAHRSGEAEAVYSQRGWGTGKDDIGNTYIEVDMSQQTMYYYKDGELKLSTPVVTGNTGKGNGTPQRVFYVYYKQRNRTLIGEDYRTPVSYWMAVYGNIGIHDATWRGKFGGSIYKTNGSHGCINTPMKAVSQLYEMVEEGTPVIMFY